MLIAVERKSGPIRSTNAFDFDPTGKLIYKRNKYYRTALKGVESIIHYRCIEYKTQKCKAKLQTKGMALFMIHEEHNHDFCC